MIVIGVFLAGRSAIDPVGQGAGRFQGTLAQIVAAVGPWPFVVALAIRGWLVTEPEKAQGRRP